MTHIYHNPLTGHDEVRDGSSTLGYYYENELTGKTEFRTDPYTTTAVRSGGQWVDPSTLESTRPY